MAGADVGDEPLDAARAKLLDEQRRGGRRQVDALTEFLAATRSRFPELRVVLEEAPSSEAARRVREGSADLAVVSVLGSDSGLEVRPLWEDPLIVVGEADGELAIEEAMRGPMIGLAEGVPLQDAIDEEARRLGLAPEYRLRLPSLGAVYAVASAGAGRAILPLGTARRLGAPERLVHRMSEPWAQRRAVLLARAGERRSGVEAAFIDAMLRYRAEVEG